MSIAFKNIASTGLNLKDKITSGKLAGCRVCDVIADHSEYLLWLTSKQYIKFKPEVLALLQHQQQKLDQQRHYEEEVLPWLTDVPF